MSEETNRPDLWKGRPLAPPAARRLAVWAFFFAWAGALSLPFRAWSYDTVVYPARHLSPGWNLASWCVAALSLLGIALAVYVVRRTPPVLRRPGREFAAIVVGIVALGATVFGADEIDRDHLRYRGDFTSSCLSNVKQIGIGIQMYAQDYDDILPHARAWQDDLFPYLKNRDLFQCPRADDMVPTYAFNLPLSGRKLTKVDNPAETITIFDSIAGPNLAGGANLLPQPPRHDGGHNIGFLDGHAKYAKDAEARRMLAQPLQFLPSKK